MTFMGQIVDMDVGDSAANLRRLQYLTRVA